MHVVMIYALDLNEAWWRCLKASRQRVSEAR